jgi:hypothetical protein
VYKEVRVIAVGCAVLWQVYLGRNRTACFGKVSLNTCV